ncbi:MAG: protein kinase family protein, partial [Clostridia bacterium]|nr:protein kinase family protein [Clostridia bacterium]
MPLTPSEFMPAFERYKRDRGLPRLKLGNSIGFGGFSTVFELTDGKQPLVLKVISSVGTITSPEKAIQYVHSERDTMLKCRGCEYIMPLLDYYEYPVDPQANHYLFFFVMPRLTVLTEYIKSKGVSEKLIADLTRDVCRALAYCEKNRILHRDIKHSNIYVRYGEHNE